MHDTMFLSSAFTIAKCHTRINICSTPSWSPQILHMFGWCAAARAPALIAAVGLRRVPPSPPHPWFRPPARAALRLWSPRCASAAPLHKNNRRSTSLALKKKNTNQHSKVTLYITGMVHPLKLSASSPFKRAHLRSSASILWRSCSQASSCLCWEADMALSSFSRSFSSAISNWSSLLCRWTVEPFRSFTGHFDETQRSDNSQKIF